MAYYKTKNMNTIQQRRLTAAVERYQAAQLVRNERRKALALHIKALVNDGVAVAEIARNCQLTTHQIAALLGREH